MLRYFARYIVTEVTQMCDFLFKDLQNKRVSSIEK